MDQRVLIAPVPPGGPRDARALLGEIAEEFERLSRLARGVRKVTVCLRVPAGRARRRRAITRVPGGALRPRVELETEVRPSLIGGVVAESEGQEIEFSIEGG